MSVGEIAGPLAAGVLVATAGPGSALAGDAVTFAVSALLLARLDLPAPPTRTDGSFLLDLRAGWAAFRSRRWVWATVASIAIGNMMWAAWSALGHVVADRDLGGPAAWGVVLAAMGVGALGGSLLATWAEPRRPLLLVAVAGGVFAIPLALLAARAPVPVLAAGTLVSGGAMMLGNAVWQTTLQRRIPAGSLSHVSAYDWFGAIAFYPVGLALWATVAARLGVGKSLWLASRSRPPRRSRCSLCPTSATAAAPLW
jgi:hypothetical protein